MSEKKRLEALEKENTELRTALEAERQETALRDAADLEATKVAEQVRAEGEALNARLAEMVQEKVRQMVPEALGAVTVTPRIVFPETPRAGNLTKADRQLLDLVTGRKAMDTATGGSGSEWVPTELRDEVLKFVQVANKLRGYLPIVQMPSDTYTLPTLTGNATVYYKGENVAPTAGSPATGKSDLVAKKLIGLVEWSYELDENSVVPMLGLLKENLGKALGNAEERAIVWGDTTAVAANNIDKNVAAGNPQLAFNGLWKTVKGGTATWFVAYGTSWAASLRAARQAMDVYGSMPQDLLVIVPPYVFNKIVTDDGFLTWDKLGGAASALTGLLPGASPMNIYGLFDGSPVVVSSYVYKTDANGVRLTTTASNTAHNALMVHRPSVILGERQQVRIEVDRDITAQTHKIVASERIALALPWGGTTGAYAAVYNGS
jgi:hypothetical protein